MKRDYVYISCILFFFVVVAAGAIHKQYVDGQVAITCIKLQSISTVCEKFYE